MAYSNAWRRHLRFGRFPPGGQVRARNWEQHPVFAL